VRGMLTEILVGVLVIGVALLVITDSVRTKIEGPYGQGDGPAPDARPRIPGAAAGRAGTFHRDSAGTPVPAAGYGAGPARHPEGLAPKKSYLRSRLLLLVIIPAVAVTVIAFCVGGLIYVLQGARINSPSSSARDGAMLSALLIGVVMIIALLLAAWLTFATVRSVLQPLYRLRVKALEAAGGLQPDAARQGSENASADPESVDADSTEIGDMARAFSQIRAGLLRMTANEASLRGRLDAMFVNMSNRSQSQVERQLRLIENMEHTEQDRERLAYLARMNRIAARMHRSSQNLLVLAGHELSTGWNQPMALVNIIRAVLSEIEEYERVSVHAPPDVAVSGPAVSDVVHLLAELTENATSFSAVDMPVEISGYLMNSGVVIDISDRGVGMGAKELAYANWRLENPPTADIDIPKWVGLLVVARLSARHGIKVRLQQAEFGGLTALVWLPSGIITQHGASLPSRPGAPSAGSRRGSHEAAGDPGRGGGGVTAPSAGTRRLPIFDSVEARWTGGDEMPGPSGVPAPVGGRGPSPADEHSRAAAIVNAPTSGASTSAGLPKRQPNANPLPGSIPGTDRGPRKSSGSGLSAWSPASGRDTMPASRGVS
jgi:signal transduction histidine kinase